MDDNFLSHIQLIHADITKLRVDAIVNAANNTLLGGGGVDGAIHAAAGPQLLEACKALPQIAPGIRCPTGEACATQGFELPATYVIHTVGPIWHGGTRSETQKLANCYFHALELAQQLGCTTVAFPAISCGVYAYPLDQAAHIAKHSLLQAMRSLSYTPNITFCLFNDATLDAFIRVFQE